MIFGKYINRYYWRYSPMILLGLISLITVDYFQLFVPELYRIVINAINTGKTPDGAAFDMPYLLDHICLPLIGVLAIMVVGRFLWRVCLFGAGIKVETSLRSRMFDHCRELSQQYYQVNKVGNLMSLFTNDLETVQDCFGSGILMFFDALFLGTLALWKMWRMNHWLTAFCMIPMSILFVISSIVGHYMEKKWDVRQEAFSSLSDFSQESFSGIAVIRAFVKETKELLAFRKLNIKNEDTNVDYTRISTLLHILVTLFVETVICVILGYGGFLVYSKDLDAGQLMEFIGYFNAIVWPVMAISELIEMRSRGRASLDRISKLFDAKPDVIDRPDVESPENLVGEISFRHLTFRYPDTNRDVLTDITFDVKPGESVGIIGKTGSGKTTLVDLLLRIYNLPDGTLFLDGKDINTLSIDAVRNGIAYVPQDNFLFSDTIESNIAFADNTASPEIIEAAAKLSDIHEAVSDFPDGYKTMLGERGVTVSGGQKQRISIARALMKDAAVLILDDSVSAVDTATEKAIIENLRRVRQGKTTMLIAHRITTVRQMDKILFLEDGRVADFGTHDELIERCASYRTMVELQKLDEERREEA